MAPVAKDLELIIVIPAFNESSLMPTLLSIQENELIDPVAVIIVFNNSDATSETIRTTNRSAYEEVLHHSFELKCWPMYIDNIPSKQAGVGLARKIGMDTAAQRFKSIGKNGIIACLDADCTVADNYNSTLIQYFKQQPEVAAASIHYEHPFPEDKAAQQYIIDYELHLRYHINFQKYLGLPYAYQTVGSSMAVRSVEYTKQGGMNKRKAGEDFYFIHKFTAIEQLGEIKDTTVFPSARVSHRVPFGTGKAIFDRLEGKDFGTYHYKSYQALQSLIDKVPLLYDQTVSLETLGLATGLEHYLFTQDFDNVIQEIKRNTTTFEAFQKRFYQYFNAFRLMKYLHYMRDHHYDNLTVEVAAAYLYQLLNQTDPPEWTVKDYLHWLRAVDKKVGY